MINKDSFYDRIQKAENPRHETFLCLMEAFQIGREQAKKGFYARMYNATDEVVSRYLEVPFYKGIRDDIQWFINTAYLAVIEKEISLQKNS